MKHLFKQMFVTISLFAMVIALVGCGNTGSRSYSAPPITTQTTTTASVQPAFPHPNDSECSAWQWDNGEQSWYCDDDSWNYAAHGGFFYYGGGYHTTSYIHHSPSVSFISTHHITFVHHTTVVAPKTTTRVVVPPKTTSKVYVAPRTTTKSYVSPPKSSSGTGTVVKRSTTTTKTTTTTHR